jgi:hypothetical protein
MLENDERKQSISLNNKLIRNFVEQNRIDQLGVTYFYEHINDSDLTRIVQKAVLRENSRSTEEQLVIPTNIHTTSLSAVVRQVTAIHPFGSGLMRELASLLYNYLHNKKSKNEAQQFEKMLSFLRVEYTALQNSPYYDNNLLPIPELANECVQHIREAIEFHDIKSQKMINTWYTSYGIMLKIFCDENYNYINKKLISEFEQEISRRKEEVRQNIANASTAEEHGQALIKQIWTIIQNDTQKQFQNQFERVFTTWDEYHPSIISENYVNQLFRTTKYQEMFNYIRDPTVFIKDWLRLRFNEKYQTQLNQKMKFSRMILSWHNAIQASNFFKICFRSN